MSESMVCPYSRQQAVNYYRQAEIVTPEYPEALPAPDSAEAYTIYAETKPAQYALLGPLIDSVIDHALSTPLIEQKNRFIRTDWDKLARDIEQHLRSGIGQLHTQPTPSSTLEQASESHRNRYRLRPHIYPRLSQSLEGGASTAANTTVGTVRDFDAALRSRADRLSILRRSYGTVIEFASCSSLQLSPLEDLRQRKSMPPVIIDEKSQTAMYSPSPLDAEVDGYMQLHFQSLLGGFVTAKTLREIGGNKPIIGCPILFKPKQVQQFWNWTIDRAIERELI